MLSRTDLFRRLGVSSIVVLAVVGLVAFAHLPWFQFLVAAVVAGLSAIAVWEYDQFAKAKGGHVVFPALVVLTVAEVLSFFAVSLGAPVCLPAVVFFLGFLVLFALHFRQNHGAIVDLAVSAFGLLYIALPTGMFLGILYGAAQPADGRFWLGYLLAVTKITDMGAYFGGSLWGKRKLAPTISPKKTVEGAVCGLICALGVSFLCSSVLGLTTVEWLFLGLILGLVGQFGDLSESLLKRDANKKDSNALPGLGGVLDSLDSLLFNAPIVYFYLQYIR